MSLEIPPAREQRHYIKLKEEVLLAPPQFHLHCRGWTHTPLHPPVTRNVTSQGLLGPHMSHPLAKWLWWNLLKHYWLVLPRSGFASWPPLHGGQSYLTSRWKIYSYKTMTFHTDIHTISICGTQFTNLQYFATVLHFLFAQLPLWPSWPCWKPLLRL